MKEKLKNKKVVYSIIGIVSVLLVAAAVTYAYWLVTKTQQGENVISSGCLDITVGNEANDISLTNQFPLSDEDGKKLTPYTFTVTNNCNTSVDYQIALEAIGEESTSISSNALKVALNDDVKLFSSYTEVDTTVSGAYEARRLGFSRLSAKGSEGASDSYSLRIWIDENADISEMNKTFISKISVTIGQGFANKYEEGTLAYSILSNYGGTEGIETLSTEWTEGTYGTETSEWMQKSTSYYWGTEMDFNETNGKYKLGGTVVQATTAECRNGQKSDGTAITCSYTLRNSTDAEYETKTGYKVTSLTSSSKNDTSSTLYITVQKTGTASNSFSKATTADDTGLYKAKDDLGDSYYFRGNPTNNYVKFGVYAEESTITTWDDNEQDNISLTIPAGSPMYWRIVRINGDGSIRLIYDGTEKVANGVAHTATIAATAYNTNYDDAKYVGYTYDVGGTETNSTIKGVVDAWYDKHLKTTYGSYIADGIFCNDRSGAITADAGSITYAPYDRLSENKAPVLTCTNKEDRYTTSTELGNGKLTDAEGNARPIGLLTADEAFMAGGTNASNMTYYLYSGETYWTSVPHNFVDFNGANVWYVLDDGGVYYHYVDISESGARPVINLKADVLFEGKGTIDSPYKLASQN